jgi:8-oxo-dGTP diphosphatase
MIAENDMDVKVRFYDKEEIADELLKFAVLMSEYNGQWIFVRHRERTTWEIPGGHREPDEEIDQTAKRELYEETGALSFETTPICIYSVEQGGILSYGELYHASIHSIGNLPVTEIAQIRLLDGLPDNLTYPLIQPHLFNVAVSGKHSGLSL